MRFLVQRTARAILTLWVGLSIAFFIIRFMPGNPLDLKRYQIATEECPQCTPAEVNERVQAYADRIGVTYDAPIHEQYVGYWTDLFSGDLGTSVVVKEGDPVTQIVAGALPWTLFVVVASTVIMAIIAITWGAVIAYKEGTWLDSISSSGSILTAAMPYYVLAFFLILILGYNLGWFPTKWTTGRGVNYTDGVTFLLDAVYHAALPIASIVITQAGIWILSMRGNSIQVLGEDYVRVARLRGLSDRRISTRYVARNAMLPLYTGFLMLIGYNMGASVILEEIFTYKGIGYYMLQGLRGNDYALVMGTFIVYAAALVIAVYIADLTYSYIDPRVKSGGTSEAY